VCPKKLGHKRCSRPLCKSQTTTRKASPNRHPTPHNPTQHPNQDTRPDPASGIPADQPQTPRPPKTAHSDPGTPRREETRLNPAHTTHPNQGARCVSRAGSVPSGPNSVFRTPTPTARIVFPLPGCEHHGRYRQPRRPPAGVTSQCSTNEHGHAPDERR
jgi:hypothetical protein